MASSTAAKSYWRQLHSFLFFKKRDFSLRRLGASLKYGLTLLINYRALTRDLRAYENLSCGDSGDAAAEFSRLFDLNDYCLRGLSFGLKRKIFLHHHEVVRRCFPLAGIDQLASGIRLWGHRVSGQACHIVLSKSKVPREGELSLDLWLDQTRVYSLSFTFVPGEMQNKPGGNGILVARLQGRRDLQEQMRLIANSFFRAYPPSLLLAALYGVATHVDAEFVLAVSSKGRFVALEKELERESCMRHDSFWEENGGALVAPTHYRLPPRIPDARLANIRRQGRARALKRHGVKLEVAEAVRASLQGLS